MNTRTTAFAILSLALSLLPAAAQSPTTNLVPNGNFSATDPLQGWRVDFPYEGWYTKNKTYVTATSEHAKPGSKCVQIALPAGVAGNEGGKIESAFIKAEPGATYRVEIDCLPWDFTFKTFVEAWVTDPKPVKGPDKFRVPERDGHPALLMIYRAQIPDPKAGSKEWHTVSREFKLPAMRKVGEKDMPPEFLSVKAFTYMATPKAGKCFVGNFRLFKIQSAQ